jgi:FMN hydrolase / 5-amino-6-(5-phospho-D-ribitylamino)uracil phosphatase
LKPSVILWDLMDTLVRDPFFTHMAPFFGLGFEELLASKHPSAWGEFELGRIDEQELYQRFFRDGRAIDGEGLKRCMQHAYAWIEGMEPLVQELQGRGVQMHLLSNYPHWYRLCDERLGVSRYVRLSFVSCHTGVRKPAPEAYLNACRTLNVGPGDCLFVDDREPNCEAARALRMDSVRFEGVDALRKALESRGLL